MSSAMDALLSGAGGPPAAGGGVTSQSGSPGAVTGPHSGGLLDFPREAVLALQHFAEQSQDDQDIAIANDLIAQIQKKLIAPHAKDRDAALGIGPAHRAARRAKQGY
jgi:hypothetical protein